MNLTHDRVRLKREQNEKIGREIKRETHTKEEKNGSECKVQIEKQIYKVKIIIMKRTNNGNITG